MKLDLGRPRELGEIISGAFELFFAHSAVFYTATLIVVAPVVILVDGVWGRQLADGADAKAPVAAQLVSLLLMAFVVPVLVTSLHARAVQGLGEGHEPELGPLLKAALRLFPAVAGVVVLASLGVGLASLALVIPGLYLLVRWYFAAQAAAIEGRRGPDALRRSAALVDGQWWRVAIILLVLVLLTGAITTVLRLVLAAIGPAVLYVIASVLLQALALSLSALGGTLLFFDLRARQEVPA